MLRELTNLTKVLVLGTSAGYSNDILFFIHRTDVVTFHLGTRKTAEIGSSAVSWNSSTSVGRDKCPLWKHYRAIAELSNISEFIAYLKSSNVYRPLDLIDRVQLEFARLLDRATNGFDPIIFTE